MKHSRAVLILSLLFFSSCSTEITPIYTLNTTVNPAEAGTISITGGEFDKGTKVKISASPNEGWIFNRWLGDASGSDQTTIVEMDSNKSITASFSRRTYPLMLKIKGGGIVNERIVHNKATEYEHGTRVELTAKSNNGWTFEGWTGDLKSAENPVVVTVTEATNLTATFRINLYDLKIVTEGRGEVNISVLSGGTQNGKVEHGSVIELQAIPSEGWKFYQWELHGEVLQANPTEILIKENQSIEVHFIGTETFYLAENGVTVKCPEAKVGEKGFLNGLEFEAVDLSMLYKRVNQGADLSKVCTSLLTNVYYIFENNSTFNQPIGNWDVSNITNMSGMFLGARSFNQPIEHWDVSNVIVMYRMFAGAHSFNQAIGNWDVSNVSDMIAMFSAAISFNQPIGEWDVSNVKGMLAMFSVAKSFNQPIGDWDVSNVILMADMFSDATRFNQDLTNWCVSNFEKTPQDFSTGSPLKQEYHPIWGSCPE
jgi:uncharacterized repeat protein (TIGR02543 family)